MDARHFTPERIEEINTETVPMTPEERAFLLEDIPSFDECRRTREELSQMDDKELLAEAVWTWEEYCKA